MKSLRLCERIGGVGSENKWRNGSQPTRDLAVVAERRSGLLEHGFFAQELRNSFGAAGTRRERPFARGARGMTASTAESTLTKPHVRLRSLVLRPSPTQTSSTKTVPQVPPDALILECITLTMLIQTPLRDLVRQAVAGFPTLTFRTRTDGSCPTSISRDLTQTHRTRTTVMRTTGRTATDTLTTHTRTMTTGTSEVATTHTWMMRTRIMEISRTTTKPVHKGSNSSDQASHSSRQIQASTHDD